MSRKLYATLHHNFLIFAKSPAAVVSFVLPIVLLLLIGTIKPASWILPQVITISVITICFLSVGTQYANYKETNFFKTITNTGLSRNWIIFGTFFITLTLSLLISFFLIILTMFFTISIPLLCQTIDNIYLEGLSDFQSFLKDNALFSTMSFSDINFATLIYSLIVTVSLTSLMAIMFSNIISNTKAYILFSIMYILLFVLLSGMVIPLSIIVSNKVTYIMVNLIPNYHTNNMISSSINVGMSKEVGQYIMYLEGVGDWLEKMYNGGNPKLVPFENIEGLDPINLSIISSAFPYLWGVLSAATNIINIIGNYVINILNALPMLEFDFDNISLEANSSSAIQIYFTVLFFTSDGLQHYILGMENIIHSLIIGFRNIYPLEYAFGMSKFAIETNVLPIIYTLITVPFFIKAVRK